MKRIITFIKDHDETSFGLGLVLALLLVGGFIYGYIHHLQTKARTQAINRAKKMDGRTFTIDNVAWNWIGDTKLILKNEQGQDIGWVMIYMANPLDSKINPLTLAFTHPHDPVPVPMKVKAHFRETPWASKYDGKVKDNFTGSYIEFEGL
jgi:hypothetical protein